VEDLDVATAGVEEALRVTRPNENAGVIRIQFEAADPRVTRDVPNALADAYLARRRAAQTTEARSSARFLAEQLDTARRQLAAAEDTLRGFREREGVVDPAAEASTGITRRSELQAQRTALEAERRSLGAILTDVRARAASGDPAVPSPYRRLVGFPSFVRNPAAAELLRSITAVEDQRALLLQRRTLEDPSVQVLTARVAQLEDQLRGVVVTYYEGLAGQVGALDAALSRSAQQLSRLPGREAEFERLRRRPTTLADVYGLLQTRLKEAQIAEAVEDASVRVVDRATLPRRPVKPNKALVLGLAGVLGLAAGVVLAFLRTQLVPVVHSREDVRRLVGLPVLGVVPRARGHAAAATAADGVAAEAYRRLRTNVLAAAQPDGGPAILLVTSPSPAEGKTTVAVNVAAAIARQGSRVLLADADLRHGELTERLLPASGAAVRPTGLAGVLQAGDDAALPAVGRPVDVGGAQLDLLAAGRAPAAPADLLAAPAMRRLIERLRASYDVVVIDSPAVNAVADAAVLAGAVDGVLLVVRSGRTRLSAITAALEQLAAVGAPVLGIVLNGGDAEDGGAGARRLGRRR
jgi:capsular exopolysaccharide synthesis family protein